MRELAAGSSMAVAVGVSDTSRDSVSPAYTGFFSDYTQTYYLSAVKPQINCAVKYKVSLAHHTKE